MDYKWMSEDQVYCYEMLCDWLGGSHHVPNIKPFGLGIKCSVYSTYLSTFDFDRLTKLVFLAHDRCIRVEMCNGGPCRTSIALHRRHTRVGGTFDRHPTVEQALTSHREQWPLSTCALIEERRKA